MIGEEMGKEEGEVLTGRQSVVEVREKVGE